MTLRITCMNRHFLAIFFLLSANIVVADQSLTIGNPIAPNRADLQNAPVRTDIDLHRPASGSGSVSGVTYNWTSDSCSDSFKIKFFRRIGETLRMSAERGPFAVSSDHAVSLVPQVPVQQGDLIGVTRLSGCGSPQTEANDLYTEGYVQFAGDISGSVDIGSGTKSSTFLGIFGQGVATEVLAAVIPVVGTANGAFGSNFKTSLQVVNGIDSWPPFAARLVFHPAHVPGSPGDPSITLAIDGGQVIGFTDVVATMGQNGLGSIDVLIPPTAILPTFVTRIYNTASSGGKTGLAEDDVIPTSQRLLHPGNYGILICPSNPDRERFNIGIRTLFSGAQVVAILRSPTGGPRAKVVKHYSSSYFEQVDASTFFDGATIDADDWIQFQVQQGSAIIYGSTTDNVTNDAAIQFATWTF